MILSPTYSIFAQDQNSDHAQNKSVRSEQFMLHVMLEVSHPLNDLFRKQLGEVFTVWAIRIRLKRNLLC